MKHTTRLAALAALVGSSSLCGVARAEDGAVALAGETFFVLKAPMDLDRDIQYRADGVYDRLRYVLNNPKLAPRDIQVKPMGDYGVKIVANGQLIVPIGDAEAAAHGKSRMALAQEWAQRLRRVLPPRTAQPFSLAPAVARR